MKFPSKHHFLIGIMHRPATYYIVHHGNKPKKIVII